MEDEQSKRQHTAKTIRQQSRLYISVGDKPDWETQRVCRTTWMDQIITHVWQCENKGPLSYKPLTGLVARVLEGRMRCQKDPSL